MALVDAVSSPLRRRLGRAAPSPKRLRTAEEQIHCAWLRFGAWVDENERSLAWRIQGIREQPLATPFDSGIRHIRERQSREEFLEALGRKWREAKREQENALREISLLERWWLQRTLTESVSCDRRLREAQERFEAVGYR